MMASFKDNDPQLKILKEDLIKEGTSVKKNLSRTDREFCRLFFNYETHPLLPREPPKKYENAPAYIKDTIFERGPTNERDEDGNNSPDKDYSQRTSSNPVPRIFCGQDIQIPPGENFPIYSEWFSQGKGFSDQEQIAFVRSMQTFARVFEADLCLKRQKHGSKIFIAGPVN